jgi:hypothetical protein
MGVVERLCMPEAMTAIQKYPHAVTDSEEQLTKQRDRPRPGWSCAV